MKKTEISKKSSKPIGTVLFMTAATLLSKLLGMLRGIIFAAIYSDSMEANAFTVASHIPLTCFDLLLSAAILGCFIPVYAGLFGGSKEMASGDGDEFAAVFLNTIILITSLLSLIGIIFAGPLVSLMAPGLDESTEALAVKLLRILFPMIIFTGSAYTLVGVMQTRGRYMLPAMISAISNGCIIIYMLAIAPNIGDGGIWGLAVTYLIAWFIQFMTLAVPLHISGFRFRPKLDFKNPALNKALKQLPPIMAGSWLMPVTIYSGIFFISLITDKVAIFEYANSIYVLVTGILTYSLCNYIFPKLSKLSGAGDGDSYVTASVQSLKIALGVIIPFTAAVIVLHGEGTSIVYLRGNFSPESAELTALAVCTMAVGMPFFAVNEMLSRAFYARQRTIPPMTAALIGIAVNILTSVLVVSSDNPQIWQIGLPYAFGQAASAITLAVIFFSTNKGAFTSGDTLNVIKLLISGAAAFAVMYIIRMLTHNDPYTSGILVNILICAAVFIPGAAVYVVLLRLLGVSFTDRGMEKVTQSEQNK